MEKIDNNIIGNQVSKDLVKALTQNIFYKYASFEIASKNIITDNTLKFSNPKSFNDPFDCHEGLINISKLTNEELEEIIFSSDNVNNNPNKDFIQKNKKRIIQKVTNKLEIKSLWRKQFEHYRVCCFSKTYHNILMWSHYADCHKGIVIGFNLPILNDKFVVYPVTYADKILPIDGYTDVLKVLYYWVTTKSNHWAYEEEFRAINKDRTEYLSFDKEWIKEIIFGCKVPDKEISKTISMMRKLKYKNFMVKKMVIDEDTFSHKEIVVADIQNFKNKTKSR